MAVANLVEEQVTILLKIQKTKVDEDLNSKICEGLYNKRNEVFRDEIEQVLYCKLGEELETLGGIDTTDMPQARELNVCKSNLERSFV